MARLANWLRRRVFPPASTRAVDLDRMFEQFEEEDREKRRLYPVRWRIERIWDFLSRWPRVGNALYWLRTHTYNRYHILDLRKAEPENPDGYRWGWLDRCDGLRLANFLVLREFVERERPWDCSDAIQKAEAEGDPHMTLSCLRHQQANWEECMLLYRWWTKDRFAEYERFEADEDTARAAYQIEATDERREIWLRACNAKEQRETEMILRLVALRGYLWT